MKALHDRTQVMQDQRVVADVAARIAVIFDQYPMLCGFSVQECSTLVEDRAVVRLPGELCLTDVTASTWPGFRVTQEFCEQIANMLLDLMDEQPEASDLLPGCTFARALH
jgi:hypothetical protein